MNQVELFKEITQTYQKFGWQLRSVLLDETAVRELAGERRLIPENVSVVRGQINALWFARVSNARETWELRVLSASPYALLETFEPDTPESEREKRLAIMLEKLQNNQTKFSV